MHALNDRVDVLSDLDGFERVDRDGFERVDRDRGLLVVHEHVRCDLRMSIAVIERRVIINAARLRPVLQQVVQKVVRLSMHSTSPMELLVRAALHIDQKRCRPFGFRHERTMQLLSMGKILVGIHRYVER